MVLWLGSSWKELRPKTCEDSSELQGLEESFDELTITGKSNVDVRNYISFKIGIDALQVVGLWRFYFSLF